MKGSFVKILSAVVSQRFVKQACNDDHRLIPNYNELDREMLDMNQSP